MMFDYLSYLLLVVLVVVFLSAAIRILREYERGIVFTHGERWQARGVEALTPGETVEVAGMKDLTLVVRRRSARTVSEGGV